MIPRMHALGRCVRGFLLADLIRGLRRCGAAIDGLDEADRQLIAVDVDPSVWIDREQARRLAAAAHERACAGDWSRFHELSAGSIERILDLGYRAVLRSRDPARTFAGLSVLWRASFSFGRALAHTDRRGVTIHVIDCAAIDELEGNLHAGWALGIARLVGAEDARVELRRRPWAGDGDEQVMRLQWREPGRRPSLTPNRRSRIASVG